jgi:hypothetical protein
MMVWGNFIINGVRFDGPQYHMMSCSIYRGATDNKPGSGGYKCDCNYEQIANEKMGGTVSAES